MSRLDVAIIKVDPVNKRAVLLKISGANLAQAVRRITGAKQLGHMVVQNIEERRLMGSRQERGRTVTFDAGPTPLIVAGDAAQEKGVPGFRINGVETVGAAVLFGKGLCGMMAVPVDLEWVAANLEWISADEADAEMEKFVEQGEPAPGHAIPPEG